MILIWSALAIVLIVPVAAAAMSPLLAWRNPVYIMAGFAGVVAMSLLLVQPLLAGGLLPGLSTYRSRRVHRGVGICLAATVVVHVVGLWITSPPDVVDALLFVSPTPFSFWGVIAMWAVFASVLLAALRRRLKWRNWRRGHTACAAVIVVGGIVHALMIQGTMETLSKAVLSALVLAATVKTFSDLRVWSTRARHRAKD